MATLTRSTIAVALAVTIAASVSTWVRADDAPVAVQIVDALNKHFGVHPGFRANHAKGIVVEGEGICLGGIVVVIRMADHVGHVVDRPGEDLRRVEEEERGGDHGGLPGAPLP